MSALRFSAYLLWAKTGCALQVGTLKSFAENQKSEGTRCRFRLLEYTAILLVMMTLGGFS
jgi:hypothetical protein